PPPRGPRTPPPPPPGPPPRRGGGPRPRPAGPPRKSRRASMAPSTVDLLLPMFRDAVEMLSLTRASFRHFDPGQTDMAMVLARSIHKQERDLTEQLLADPPEFDGLRFVPSHLDRISDAVQGLLRVRRRRKTEVLVI